MALTKHPERNRYTRLKLQLFKTAWRNKKISAKKLWNAAACTLAAHRKTSRSGSAPVLLSLELGNTCNAQCLFCRSSDGHIFNTNPAGPLTGAIRQGQMPPDTAKAALSQLKEFTLMAVLYTNGEPLLYAHLPDIIHHASTLHIPSMIATNGLLLTREKIRAILSAGIDFIKIQLSGMTPDVYNVQVRRGNIDAVKENIKVLCNEIRQNNHSTYVMIDWISYTYNAHQLPQIRTFCAQLGLTLNIRPGNPRGGLEKNEPVLTSTPLPLSESCEWPYLGMQINFNGDILPCCDAVTWSNFQPLDRFIPEKTDLTIVWNNPEFQSWRNQLSRKGRGSIPLCAQCPRKGIEFKW